MVRSLRECSISGSGWPARSNFLLYAWAVEKRTHVVFVEAEVHDSGNGISAMGQGLVSASATLETKT
jgi:hypothetical protein